MGGKTTSFLQILMEEIQKEEQGRIPIFDCCKNFSPTSAFKRSQDAKSRIVISQVLLIDEYRTFKTGCWLKITLHPYRY